MARTWAAAKREGDDEITAREVTILLTDFAAVWNELFPAEQARILRLLIERIDVAPDGISVTLHAAGIRSLVAELADQEAPALAASEPLLVVEIQPKIPEARGLQRCSPEFGFWARSGHRRGGPPIDATQRDQSPCPLF